MTYCAEFDKVHYPLPLNFDDNPDIDQLKCNYNNVIYLKTIDAIFISIQLTYSLK